MIDSVKIGDIDYRVLLGVNATEDGALASDPNERVLGEINIQDGTIFLDEKQALAIMQTTLWHEIVHGILLQAGHFDVGTNEQIVTCLGYGLAAVIRNNPDLIFWTTTTEIRKE